MGHDHRRLETVYRLTQAVVLEEDGQGIVTLADPQDHRIQRIFRRLGVRIPLQRRLTLDAYGSFVTRQFDDGASVGDIGRRLTLEYGPDAEPVFERLVPYLRALEDRRLIVRTRPDVTVATTSGQPVD